MRDCQSRKARVSESSIVPDLCPHHCLYHCLYHSTTALGPCLQPLSPDLTQEPCSAHSLACSQLGSWAHLFKTFARSPSHQTFPPFLSDSFPSPGSGPRRKAPDCSLGSLPSFHSMLPPQAGGREDGNGQHREAGARVLPQPPDRWPTGVILVGGPLPLCLTSLVATPSSLFPFRPGVVNSSLCLPVPGCSTFLLSL